MRVTRLVVAPLMAGIVLLLSSLFGRLGAEQVSISHGAAIEG
jgi:hypothetical protein